MRKAKGHAQRDTRRDEADEQRHRRAGAKRCQNAQKGRERIAPNLALARENGAGLFRAEPAAQYTRHKDNPRQQQKHLRHVIDKKSNRLARMARPRHRQKPCYPFGKRNELPIEKPEHSPHQRHTQIPKPVRRTTVALKCFAAHATSLSDVRSAAKTAATTARLSAANFGFSRKRTHCASRRSVTNPASRSTFI